MLNDKIRLFTIPNFITCLNLLSGCVGIVFALSGNLNVAMLCILMSAVFDFLDGFVARLLGSFSLVGKQLDSLADIVSFGTLPAVMLFSVLQNLIANCEMSFYGMYIVAFSPFLLTAFSALRLAKFNVDERQTESFMGLPTPANALFISSFSIIYTQLTLPVWVVVLAIALFCYLLIAEIPMFSLKIKDFSIKKYAIQLAFVALSAGVLVIMIGVGQLVAAFPVIILLYIVLSTLKWLLKV